MDYQTNSKNILMIYVCICKLKIKGSIVYNKPIILFEELVCCKRSTRHVFSCIRRFHNLLVNLQTSQKTLLFCLLQNKLRPKCWPGWSLRWLLKIRHKGYFIFVGKVSTENVPKYNFYDDGWDFIIFVSWIVFIFKLCNRIQFQSFYLYSIDYHVLLSIWLLDLIVEIL